MPATGRPPVRLLLGLASKEVPRIREACEVLASKLLLCKYAQVLHPFCTIYLEKGKIIFQIGADREGGGTCSVFLQLVTLWNILGKVYS